jgi:hypothetical protein
MRWFAKSNPDMFGQSYVVENNTAALGGIRGLGNVTGEVSPTTTSNYVTSNQQYTQTLQGNPTSGLWVDDGIDNAWLDYKGRKDYHMKTTKSFKAVKTQLTEGINDPGKLKAIFLAGGPGSGKDYVMNSTLAGEGLREINSDNAFEYLMKKHGLDMEMPDKERVEREIARGKSKAMAKEQERLSYIGRQGLIINGTASDLEQIKTIKAELEGLGYETMMVFVNTSNEVSRDRNRERGRAGGRKVPDGTDKQGTPDDSPDIRTEKWKQAQENIPGFSKLFGDKFIALDNSIDVRKVDDTTKNKVMTEFSKVRRTAQQFVRSENKNPNAKKWIEREAEKRGITYQEPKRYKLSTRPNRPIPNVVHKPDSNMMAQARRLGLSYYGFGRFGRKVGGVNKVMYHSKGGQLVRVQTMNEEKKMKNPCWKGYRVYGMKKKNGREVPNCVPANEAFEQFVETNGNKPSEREEATDSVDNLYRGMTPGQKKKKKLSQEALEASVQGGYSFGPDGIGPTFAVPRAGTPYGFGYGTAYSAGLSESIVNWMQSEKTQQKFVDKYGNLWEEKLIETALVLEKSGCGCDHSEKKSLKQLREGLGGGVNDMSMIPTQRKDDQQLTERGADSKGLYRPTEKGAGLTRKGAKHFGIKTAVTTPPSKLDPKGKAAGRRKSYCARSRGQLKMWPKAARDPNSRLRKARARWNCEE